MTQEAKILLGLGVMTLIVIVAGVFFLGKSTSSSNSSTKVDSQVLGILTQEDSHKIASGGAKLNVVEFADFQCPACASARPVMEKILVDYQGRINFVYRHFPLPQHKNAMAAAQAAEAAGEQGKFWQMYDKLYENQEEWSESDKAKEIFIRYAQDLSLNMEKFQKSMESNQFVDKVKRDQNDGYALGVNSTPTFFIGDEKIPGALSYEDFKNKIDAKLAN